MKQILVIVIICSVILSAPVLGEVCYPLNTPECQDVCGDHICGNQEGYDTCPEDCNQCVDTDSEDDPYVKGFVTCNWLDVQEDVCSKDINPSRQDLYNQLYEQYCPENGCGVKMIECEQLAQFGGLLHCISFTN